MKFFKLPFISKKTLKHSNKGDFIVQKRKIKVMKGGGHGQDNIKILKANNVDYKVNIEYNNGVRLGNVPIHKNKFKRNSNKQAWFPKNWTEKEIKLAGQHVMSLKRNQKRVNHKKYTGIYKGIKVGTYTHNGRITTIYPWYEQKGGKKK